MATEYDLISRVAGDLGKDIQSFRREALSLLKNMTDAVSAKEEGTRDE